MGLCGNLAPFHFENICNMAPIARLTKCVENDTAHRLRQILRVKLSPADSFGASGKVEKSKRAHRDALTLSFAPKDSSDRSFSMYVHIIMSFRKICLTSASARSSELEHLDAPSLIFQLLYVCIYNHIQCVDESKPFYTCLVNQRYTDAHEN